MKKFLSFIMALGLTLVAVPAFATDVTLSYNLPTSDCDGNPITAGMLGSVEIYVSETPIPSSGAACSDPSEDPPSGFTPINVPAGQTTIVVDLDAGKTYYFRARVQGPGGIWSNLSNQAMHEIPYIQVQPPSVIIIG